MPKVKEVNLTHDQLVEVSQRMHELLKKSSPSQGILEWALFRAISDEMNLDLFALEPNECSCGDIKPVDAPMCPKCASHDIGWDS